MPPPADPELAKVPSSLSPAMRTLLSGIVPMDALPMVVQMIAIGEQKGKVRYAVVTETAGGPLVDGIEGDRVGLEQAILSIDINGKIANATQKKAELKVGPAQVQMLGELGVRTIWCIDLPPGAHQIRVATVHQQSGPRRLDVPRRHGRGRQGVRRRRPALAEPVTQADGVRGSRGEEADGRRRSSEVERRTRLDRRRPGEADVDATEHVDRRRRRHSRRRDHDGMRVTGTRALVGAVGALLMMAGPRAQQPAQPPSDRPTFRAEVSLVEVSAVVTGDGDRPVVDLTKDDFEILEDGERRPVVSARFLSATATRTPQPLPAALAGARLDEVVTNRDLADAPAFVLLLDDLNVSAYDSHRAIRAGLGVLGAVPPDALVSVVNTSGEGGGLVTLGRPEPGTRRARPGVSRAVLSNPQPWQRRRRVGSTRPAAEERTRPIAWTRHARHAGRARSRPSASSSPGRAPAARCCSGS